MSTFKQADQNTPELTQTTNGMTTLVSSMNACVDLFFAAGASRGKDITPAFAKAFQENPDIATRIALWSRDIRGGAGERQLFRNLLVWMEANAPDTLTKILPLVPELGRFDDLLVFQTPDFKSKAYSLIGEALAHGNGLCAKWCPRKGNVAEELRKFFNLTPKEYRKLVVSLSSTVEQKMCSGKWDEIQFGKLPSLASARYQKAFLKHAAESYAKYKEGLVKGTEKINADAVYPYNVIQTLKKGDPDVANAQWDALPNYLGDDCILPVVDVSDSMSCAAGGSKSVTCMDVSVSLGLYLAMKQTGPFGGMFATFSHKPKIEILKGKNLQENYTQLCRADWGQNTNLEATFEEILRVAKAGYVTQRDMPKMVLILSDMQWDTASNSNRYGAKPNPTGMEMIREQYANAGYNVPKVVFWNLNDSNGVPVSFKEDGTALVSGFSPAIMTAILGAKNFTPESVMLEALMVPRYDF